LLYALAEVVSTLNLSALDLSGSSSCPENSSWTAWYDRNHPSGNCVCDLFSVLRNENPDEICENPTGVQARLVGEKMTVRQSDGVAIGLECCDSGNLNCQDYEVRFCCPTKGITLHH